MPSCKDFWDGRKGPKDSLEKLYVETTKDLGKSVQAKTMT